MFSSNQPIIVYWEQNIKFIKEKNSDCERSLIFIFAYIFSW